MDEETTEQPTLSVTSAEQVTVDGGTAVQFTLSLDATSSADITFDFTAEAEPEGDGEPRELRTDTETIPAGEPSVTVQIGLDEVDTESTEEIDFKITDASGAAIGENSESFEFDSMDDDESEDDADDDDDSDDDDDDDDAEDGDDDDEGMITLPPPARFDVDPNPQIVSESEDGAITTAEFEVSRAFPGKPPVSLDYRVVVPDDGSGADAADFGGTLPTGQLTFGPGEDGSQTIQIPIDSDGETEPTESFRVELLDPAIGDDQFQGVAGFAEGRIQGTEEPTDGGGDGDTDDGTGDDDSGDNSDGATTATRAILEPEGTLNLVDSADVFGRAGGDEGLFVADGVTGVGLDANLERLDIPKALTDLTFQVTDLGLTVSAGGTTLVSVPSLNQDVTLAVDGGSATLAQTGAQTFELTTSAGDSVSIGTESTTAGDVTLDSGGASAPEPNADSAANVFVGANASYDVADAVQAFGRTEGNEALLLTEAAQNVTADANFERFDFAQPLDALTFQVTDGGLTVSEGETTLLTVPSLNNDVDARFEGGNLTLRQTGAQEFTAEGADGGTTAIGTESTTLDLPLGDATSATAGGGTGADVTSVGPTDDGTTLDATGGDLTFDFASGDYGVTIDGFNTGDVLDARDVGGDTKASVTFANDGDQTDGEQSLTITDPTNGAQTTVRLTGLSDSQDSDAFNTDGFRDTFGDDALML